MKTKWKILLTTLILFIGVLGEAAAFSKMHRYHKHRGHKNRVKAVSINHCGHMGEKIHTVKAKGYFLDYHLLNVQKFMEGDPKSNVNMSRHFLMLYIKDKDGRPVSGAEVSHALEGADGETRKIMCVEMGEACGVSLDLKMGGNYTMSTKATVSGEELTHKFSYTAR